MRACGLFPSVRACGLAWRVRAVRFVSSVRACGLPRGVRACGMFLGVCACRPFVPHASVWVSANLLSNVHAFARRIPFYTQAEVERKLAVLHLPSLAFRDMYGA